MVGCEESKRQLIGTRAVGLALFSNKTKHQRVSLVEAIMVAIEYNGFLGPVRREFESFERAEQWLRQIGRKDLIPFIVGC